MYAGEDDVRYMVTQQAVKDCEFLLKMYDKHGNISDSTAKHSSESYRNTLVKMASLRITRGLLGAAAVSTGARTHVHVYACERVGISTCVRMSLCMIGRASAEMRTSAKMENECRDGWLLRKWVVTAFATGVIDGV